MSKVLKTHIELDDRGRPWIIGANTKVSEVALDKVSYGWDAEEIHSQHPHLSLGQIHSALAYYYDHKEEMDAEIRRQVKDVEALREASTDSPSREQLLAR